MFWNGVESVRAVGDQGAAVLPAAGGGVRGTVNREAALRGGTLVLHQWYCCSHADKHEVYSCGLNIKGQLGHYHF